MQNEISLFNVTGWLFGIAVMSVGILNLFLVHAVPGLVYLLLSLIYFPAANDLLNDKLGLVIPVIVKVILGIVIVMFTLGVSDLGDMIDKL